MYKHIILLVVCLLKYSKVVDAFVCVKNDVSDDVQITNEQRLRDKLMCNYEKLFIPLKNRSAEMNIQIDMDVQSYWIYDDHPETFHIDALITVTWNDINLKWSPNEYNSINEILIDSDDIWKPEIIPTEMDIFTSKPSILETIECKVTFNGSVKCETNAVHHGYCNTDVYYWPYELHKCQVEFMLWTFNGEIINTDVNENKSIQVTEDADDNNEWKIVNKHVVSWTARAEKNIYITEMYFFFDVQQNINNTVQLFYIGLFVLVSLNLSSFWTFFDESSRLILILMNILCHFYELENFQWLVKSGHGIPCILTFYRDSLVLTFVQLMETILLKKLYESEKPIPYLMTLLNSFINYNLIKQILFIQDDLINNDEKIENENNLEFVRKYEQNKKRQMLFFMDRIFFVCVFISYMVLVIILATLQEPQEEIREVM